MLFETLVEILDPVPRAAAFNMALDEVLLANAREPMLRFYRWETPAVSFGYFGKYAAIANAWPGRDLVRRMTGGGAVPHGEDLTYSLMVPAGHRLAECPPRDVYRLVHEAIAGVLVDSGQAIALAAAPDGRGSGVCFESPAEFDLVANERKIAGAALRRTRNGLLLQGSVQGLPALDALPSRISDAFATQVMRRTISPPEFAEAQALARSKYAAPQWTGRV